MLNLNKHTKTNLNLKLTLIFKNCSYVCARVPRIIVHKCRTQHSTEQF